ncbi:MAG TPA: hypothetical protein VJZ16_04260 [Syntrophales bacterium]|jgi:hypothetical protein|nr:hypothetical protein [Syntrophales bacterium]HLE19066.1 hypothetical protein [Syntrophales bacterium]
MSYKGVVKDNIVILDKNTKLHDGTHVIVIPEEELEAKPDFSADPFLNVDAWAPAPPADAPKDLASRHDFYLYGKQR